MLLLGAGPSQVAAQHQYLEASRPLAQGEEPQMVNGFLVLKWQELVPKDWRPKTRILGRKIQALNDTDPEALALMRQLQAEWDNAPTNPGLNGQAVRLPGYVVPLENVKGDLKELLLVPYYGACIHVPPPPANQIIHVVLATPAVGIKTMDPVWVSGKLEASRQQTDLATTGYTMNAATIAPFVRASTN
jgi:hypothetical protein